MTSPFSKSILFFCATLFASLAACGSSDSNDGSGSESQGCTADCIEADLEMPDGSKEHIRRPAVGLAVASMHRVAVGSVQEDDETGITLAVNTTKVKADEATPASSDSNGPSLVIHLHREDKEFAGSGGQVVFSALSETSGSAIDGTFDGILAKDSGSSSDVIKVTNGVFHSTVP